MRDIFSSAESIEAGSDWLTVLTENEIDAAALRSIAEHYLGLAELVRPWSMRKYHGRCGRDLRGVLGGVAYGEDLGSERVSALLQAWGQVSQRVGRSVMAYHHMRISRMDYAVTVLFDKELPPIKDWPIDEDRGNRWRTTRIVPSDGGGGTLYVGNRGSDIFGRVYDKGKQLGTVPDRLYWRWEVEYKGSCAKQAFANYAEWSESSRASTLIAREVCSWYREHGVPIPDLDKVQIGRPVIRYATRVRCSQTTIKWLHQQVAPALHNLEGVGRLGDALDALGLANGQTFMPYSEFDCMGLWEQTDFLKLLQDDSGLASLH